MAAIQVELKRLEKLGFGESKYELGMLQGLRMAISAITMLPEAE